MGSKKEERLKRKGMKTSITEGSYSSISAGAGDNYISLFAIALKSNATQIGLLTSFPGILSPIAQFFGSKLMEKYDRKKIVIPMVLIQALIWIPIAFLGFLFWEKVLSVHLPWLLIVLYSILAIVGGLMSPGWFSWMGDLVPENERGKYFSKRNRICGAISLVTILIGALMLNFFENKSFAIFGFSILFLIAFISRAIAYTYFKKQYEPKLELQKDYYFSFWAFMKKYTNFTKFTIFTALFNLAICIASPFFNVYMKNDLGFSYLFVMIVNMAMTVFILIFTFAAGKFSDKYGNLKLLYIGSFLLSLYPLLWVFIHKPIPIILITQLIGGIANAAYAISLTNFIYDTVTPQRRGLCLAYFSILGGIGVFIGSTLGGFLIDNLNTSFMKPILIVFLISAIGRFIVPALFLPKIIERRKYQEFPFSTYLINPITALGRITRQFISTSYSKKK